MNRLKTKNRTLILQLSLINGVGPTTVLKLLKYLHHKALPNVLHISWFDIVEHQDKLNFELLYEFSVLDFTKYIGLSNTTASQIKQGLSDKTPMYKVIALAKKNNIKITTLLDTNYPEMLKQIHTPPLVLYYQGLRLEPHEKYIGVVGSRKALQYSKNVIASIVPDLVTHGWHIVSGGAKGADTMAHEATLAARGRTIVVLGSGLLQPYPSSNENLFSSIVDKGGTILSPFHPNTPPDRGNFPSRNRIISGLSQGCIVVQAARKSGALITANFALEQGKTVFAVPGPIYDELSAGCHHLIKQGAKLVANSNDILEEFGPISNNQTPRTTQKILFPPQPLDKKSNNPILSWLSAPITFDELLEKTKLDTNTLQNDLFDLQLEGKIRQNFSGTWELT